MSEVVGAKYWSSVLVGSSAAILGIFLLKRFYENYYRGKFPYIKHKEPRKEKKTEKEQPQQTASTAINDEQMQQEDVANEASSAPEKIPDLTKERIELVYSKWFGKRLSKTLLHNHKASVTEEELGKYPEMWFTKNLEFDEELCELEAIQKDLVECALPLFDDMIDQHNQPIENAWQSTPEAIVTSIILLDQIPRNIYRQSAKQFSFDSIALRLAKRAIARGVDLQLHPIERVFVYLPLEHSENVKDQNTCLMLFKELAQDEIVVRDNLLPFIKKLIQYAESHLVIIQRYGRFPYRNEILQRSNTKEEEEFLKTGETFLK